MLFENCAEIVGVFIANSFCDFKNFDVLIFGLTMHWRFALYCPEVNILGVTTVFGNTKARAKIAVNLLDTAGFKQILGEIDLNAVDFIIDRVMHG